MEVEADELEITDVERLACAGLMALGSRSAGDGDAPTKNLLSDDELDVFDCAVLDTKAEA